MADKDDNSTKEDANDQDDTGTDFGGDEDNDAGTDDADWTPPTKKDWDAVQEVNRKLRRDLRVAKKAKPAGDADKDDDKPDVEKVKAETATAEAAKWKPRVIRRAAREALLAAGLALPKNNADDLLTSLIRQLDLDDVEVDDDGEVDGLDEQVDQIKSLYPEKFGTNGSGRVGRVDGADKGGQGRAKSVSERQAAQLLGR